MYHIIIIIMVVFNVLHLICFNSVVYNMKLFLHLFGLFASEFIFLVEFSNEINIFNLYIHLRSFIFRAARHCTSLWS